MERGESGERKKRERAPEKGEGAFVLGNRMVLGGLECTFLAYGEFVGEKETVPPFSNFGMFVEEREREREYSVIFLIILLNKIFK